MVVGSSIVDIIKNNIQNKDVMMNEIDLFTQDLKKGVE